MSGSLSKTIKEYKERASLPLEPKVGCFEQVQLFGSAALLTNFLAAMLPAFPEGHP